MKLQFPFIQLPITFDAAALAEEVLSVDDKAWRAREDGATGNSALTLITANGNPDSSALAGPMRPTPWLERCPYTMQVLGALGATWGRTRLMRLDGRSQVPPHIDTDYYWRERMRVHVPIVTSPSVRFQCGDAEIHMATGECWIFDTWRRHRVLNTGDATRIHLVADTVGGSALWDLINAGRPPDARMPNWTPRHMAPDTNAATPQLDFESINLPLVMSPWEIRTHVGFLLSETLPHPALPMIQQTLAVFLKRWHALWSCYGEAEEGWPRYRALLDATRADLVARRVNEVGLRNEVGLMHSLTSHVLGVALNDGPDAGAFRTDPHDAALFATMASPAATTPTTPTTPTTAKTPIPDGASASSFDRPVFIVSPPRSGSTLLFETLSAAPDLYTIGDESHLLIEGVLGLSPIQRGYDSNRLLADDASDAIVAKLRASFHASLRDRDGQPASDTSPARMLEKTPKNALRIPFLRKIFPEARFIYLHRDPRQVLGSMIDGWRSGGFRMYPQLPGWTGLPWSFLLVPGWRDLIGKPLEEVVAAQWQRTTQILLDDLAELDAHCWTSVDYSQLLADPQAQIGRLCDWAGLSWDRTLGKTLPLSRSTISQPDANKWRRHADMIEPRLPDLASTEARIAGIIGG